MLCSCSCAVSLCCMRFRPNHCRRTAVLSFRVLVCCRPCVSCCRIVFSSFMLVIAGVKPSFHVACCSCISRCVRQHRLDEGRLPWPSVAGVAPAVNTSIRFPSIRDGVPRLALTPRTRRRPCGAAQRKAKSSPVDQERRRPGQDVLYNRTHPRGTFDCRQAAAMVKAGIGILAQIKDPCCRRDL